MPKKVSKWFRIGIEGDTCDGREIDAKDIQQMAESYSAKAYGARVNLEHIKGILPTSDFRRYGDVTELKAEQIDEANEPLLHGKWALFAKITPTEDLTQMVGKGQKVYTSMEIQPNFAKSGKAYLVGLAVTDDPASLGTEMLEFSRKAQNNPLAARKSNPENLFSVATEVLLEFEDVADAGPNFYSRIKQLLSRKQDSDDARFKDVHEAVEAVVEQIEVNQTEQETKLSALDTSLSQRIQELEKLTAKGGEEFSALKNTLSKTQPQNFNQRPPANGSGGKDAVMTDC
ncbi:MAG: GPO family capsid scaffolding protein [Ewingella americana]|jgi:chaperonin cofactor prefoldin|uniref:GPO family capsid scaffolding protein n=1 Tax=Ewingella americana TaxID=41202 RepID=UPI002430DE8C|nr:GPO family capsid scaffolding protein [Ewingella americana]MCI1680040.1 GPO family capsid scaffolding protein [Ewingella americana]MCI1855035.1 GPO family capsid scaffolding protein [Ewingella americana]MCI1863512.1 GPO family capsid scaffolding protein [Ewingella americana]MCI2143382.1 GPO family capsid scaffolding protein [Ewingella americana]MCI2164539.1 GPO family capsid scaffolding protein [Ewingella americana]